MSSQGAGISYDSLGDLPDQLRMREGQEAIYRETGLVALVRVHGLRYDHEGVFGTATVIRPSGAGTVPTSPAIPAAFGRDSWGFMAGWGYFWLSPWGWSSTYGGWTLYFDAGLIRDVVSLGIDGYETILGIGVGPEADRAEKRFERFAGRLREFDAEIRKLGEQGRGL